MDLAAVILQPLSAAAAPASQLVFGGLTQFANATKAAIGRKFSKPETLYTPVAWAPPLLNVYECAYCAFFQPADRSRPLSAENYPKCAIVGLRDEPLGDGISPAGWCVWWVPNLGEQPFQWLTQKGPVLTGQKT